MTLMSVLMMLCLMGCSNKSENTVEQPASQNTEDTGEVTPVIEGTWQTASMVTSEDGNVGPEWYVQFTDTHVNYGHIVDGAFVFAHADEIAEFEELDTNTYLVKAISFAGTEYSLQTSEVDSTVLEYYETWNEDEFPEMYRAGASLSLIQ